MTTDSPADRARGNRALVQVASLLLGVAAYARFSYLSNRFANDAGLYIAMGKAVAQGRQLYVELWDTKLPGVTLLTAPLYAVLHDRWWAWIAVQFAMMLAGVAALAAGVARVVASSGGNAADAARARLVTASIGLALLNIQWLLTTGFQLETPMLAFASIGAWATVRAIAEPTPRRAIAWAILAGVGGGLSATLKPTALAVSGAGVLAILQLTRRPGEAGRAFRLALGLLAGVGAMLLVNLAWYRHVNAWPYLGDVLREIRLYGSGTPWTQVLSAKTVLILCVLAWPAVTMIGGARRSRDARTAPPPPVGGDVRAGALVLAIAWLLAEVVGVVLQKRGYAYHFLPIAAPATLLAGLCGTLGNARARALPLVVAIAVLPAAAYSLATGFGSWRTLLAGGPTYPVALVDYVRANTAPDDTVFADPVGDLSLLTDRRPGSRLGMLISFVNHDGAPEQFLATLLGDLDDRRCTIICLPIPSVLAGRIAAWETQPVLRANPARRDAYRVAWKQFIEYVHANYTLEQPNLDGREVWRRRVDATRP